MSRRHQSLRLVPSRMDDEGPAGDEAVQAPREIAGDESVPLKARPPDPADDDTLESSEEEEE